MVKDPLLKQIEAQITAKMPPQLRPTLQRAVMAGLTIMHAPQTHQMMVNQLQKPGDPADNAGEGIAKLIGILFKQSKGAFPMKVLVAAGMILLCEGLQFMADAGMIQINNDTVAAATKSLSASFLQLFGQTPDKLQQLLQQAAAQKQAQGAQPAQPAQPTAAPPSGLIAQSMAQGA